MIAEIHGKISRTNSNLSEINEDELTGNVFGSLRYLPFDIGLKPILCNALFPESIRGLINGISAGDWSKNIEFWPYDSAGELDAYLEFEHIAIGIEAKYTSGISSDDGMDYSELNDIVSFTESNHQIQRECRIISKKAEGKDKILLLVADATHCVDIFENVQNRKLLINTDVKFGYISWQSILRELSKLNTDNAFYKVILSDLIALLSRKGFEQFHSMQIDFNNPIDINMHFKFDYINKETFCFATDKDINIKGDLYYEFR